jgi:LPXTG-motif cell wall-anchored protein
MRRLVAVFLAVSMLALPSAAAAQSAGDEQYADPFGQTEQPNGSQDQPAPEPQPAPAPATPAAPAEQAAAAQQTAAPTLPATGMPAHLLASMGALLLASGALLRRRAL